MAENGNWWDNGNACGLVCSKFINSKTSPTVGLQLGIITNSKLVCIPRYSFIDRVIVFSFDFCNRCAEEKRPVAAQGIEGLEVQTGQPFPQCKFCQLGNGVHVQFIHHS